MLSLAEELRARREAELRLLNLLQSRQALGQLPQAPPRLFGQLQPHDLYGALGPVQTRLVVLPQQLPAQHTLHTQQLPQPRQVVSLPVGFARVPPPNNVLLNPPMTLQQPLPAPRIAQPAPAIHFRVAEPEKQVSSASPLDDVDETEVEEAKEKTKAKDGLKKRSFAHAKWAAYLEKLKEYKEENGNCMVPRGFCVDPKLASWVAEQRKQYKLHTDGKPNSITEERIRLLNEIGFAWNAQEAAWANHFQDLKDFRDRLGHCNVPSNFTSNPKLNLWIKEQRRHYALMVQGKPSHMTEERAAKLRSIGFCWDAYEATWCLRLGELEDFKRKNGHCLVPRNCKDAPKLAEWVIRQRRQRRDRERGQDTPLTQKRIRLLDSVGFSWGKDGDETRPSKQRKKSRR